MSFATRVAAELKGDKAIWAVLAVLSVYSILAVYSAAGTLAYLKLEGNTEYYLFRQLFLLLTGLILTYFAHLVHYQRYSRWAPSLLAIAWVLLVYTLAFGTEINDAKRWISVPYVGLTFQTSDFAKLALIIFVARNISAKQEYIKDFNSAFLPIIGPILLTCLLIAPSNLSTAVLLFVTCLLLMFIGRVSLKFIGLLLVLGVVVFSFLVLVGMTFPEFVRVETWTSRWRDFLSDDPTVNFQANQAKIAIANGEWLGLGPGNSIQRNYLPSAHADFIYAIICEEYGVIFGGLLIIVLYLILLFRTTRLVTKSPKAFGAMLAIGLSILLVSQAFFNIAVAVNLVPVTGLPLPLVSMGGTSGLFTCIAFGLILSVSKYIETVSN